MRDWRPWLALAVLNVGLLLPRSVSGELAPWLALGLCGDLMIIAGLLAWVRRPALAAAVWTLLLVYELDRFVGHWLMGQDPLLFDQVLLLRHLVVLARDLMGVWGVLALVGVVVVVVLLGLGAWGLFRVGQRASGLRWALFASPLVLLLEMPAGPWPGRFVTPDLVFDLAHSVRVYRGLQEQLGALHPELEGLQLRAQPDVEVHIVESYGRMMDSEELREGWVQALVGLEARLGQAGWTTMSAFSTSPVSGGRSWIADASLLLGLQLQHQSEYERVIEQVEGLPHMPGWFAERGYSTVVMRPKDRVRPGVGLRNDFGWQHTVFFEDLDYSGAAWGWGVVPDQYSLGWLREELWSQLPGPRLLFFHMVGSHAPWNDVPPVLEQWRDFDDGSAEAPEDEELSLKRVSRRYKREKRTRAGAIGKLALRGEDFRAAVLTDLEVLTRDLEMPRQRPAVVLILGDHQPPLLSRSQDFDVVVHVLATDPSLIEGFAEQGFQPGLVPSGEPVVPLEGLYPLLVTSLSH